MSELSHIDPGSAALLVMDYHGRYAYQVHGGCEVRRCDRVRGELGEVPEEARELAMSSHISRRISPFDRSS